MIEIEVDYSHRNREGQVISQVSPEILNSLCVGESVRLFDPIEGLYAEAKVTSFSPSRRWATFEVDWQSFWTNNSEGA